MECSGVAETRSGVCTETLKRERFAPWKTTTGKSTVRIIFRAFECQRIGEIRIPADTKARRQDTRINDLERCVYNPYRRT